MADKDGYPRTVRNVMHGSNMYQSSMSGNVINNLCGETEINELKRLLRELSVRVVDVIPAGDAQRSLVIHEINALSRAVAEHPSGREVRNRWDDFKRHAAPYLQHLANISQIGAFIDALWPS